MKKTPEQMEERLQGLYEKQKLPEHVMRTMCEQVEASLGSGSIERGSRVVAKLSRWGTLVVAACLVLVVGFVAVQQSNASADPFEMIAREVAQNHNRNLRLDIETDCYIKMSEQMREQLGFSVVAPELLGSICDGELRVVGSRFCSLRSIAAAQIRLVDCDGRTYTLYETKMVSEKMTRLEEPKTFERDGLEVTVWQEGGLQLALAKPISR